MKIREFVYIGEPASELNEREHAAFFLQLQRSIVISLEEKRLLTQSQKERCIDALERLYDRKL